MPREDVSEERRAQILEAAITVFAEHGIHQATMDEVARKSGLSKGAVYLHYKSKDALISALMRSMFLLELKSLRAAVSGPGTATERIMTMARALGRELERLSVAMPLLLEFYVVAARQKSERDYLAGMYTDYIEVLRAIIQQGIERGEYREVDTQMVAVSVFSILEGVTLLWVMAPQSVRWREQSEAAVNLLIEGLRPH